MAKTRQRPKPRKPRIGGYVLRGHRLSECWQDDADGRVVHGGSELLGIYGNGNDASDDIVRYLVRQQVVPGEYHHFVTITETDRRGRPIVQRLFTAADFSPAFTRDGAERVVLAVAHELMLGGAIRRASGRTVTTKPVPPD